MLRFQDDHQLNVAAPCPVALVSILYLLFVNKYQEENITL